MRSRPYLLALGILAGAAVPASAKFARTWESVPISRLLENVGKYVQMKPEDAAGHYTLGRLHSLAFVRGADLGDPKVEAVIQRDGKELPLPGFPPFATVTQKPATPYRTLTEPVREHLLASLREYKRATQLDPKDAVAWLGYAWMLEQSLPWAADLTEAKQVPFLEKIRKDPQDNWKDNAIAAYRSSFDLRQEADRKRGHFGPGADTSVALEAGEGLLRLLGPAADTQNREEEVKRIKGIVKELQSKPRAITPILFPLDCARPLESLLDARRTARFDLAGDGRSERWPWLQSETALLVWDPEGRGRITSGRQLFGNGTWSMFWRNGYEPLAALDDDRNGFLEGRELTALSAWQDRNGDGISQAGEVRPISALGIVRVAVRGKLTGGTLGNAQGMQRGDGSWLPTYDWLPTSLPEKP